MCYNTVANHDRKMKSRQSTCDSQELGFGGASSFPLSTASGSLQAFKTKQCKTNTMIKLRVVIFLSCSRVGIGARAYRRVGSLIQESKHRSSVQLPTDYLPPEHPKTRNRTFTSFKNQIATHQKCTGWRCETTNPKTAPQKVSKNIALA